MCLSASLVGVIVFLKKQSLLGESLSHAAYPGVIFGIILAGLLQLANDELNIALLIMFGAFISANLGLFTIHYLEKKLKVPSDAALCFVLSAFFGIGLSFVGQVQHSYSLLYAQAQVYLYGQAATMTDTHIAIYGTLSLVMIGFIALFYKEIKTISFDRQYAASLGINTKFVDTCIVLLIVLAVIIGIRSVGVVLMSAMFIAPAVAARQYTNRLSRVFVLSGFFGLLSGFLGNYFSVELPEATVGYLFTNPFILPTGPMIVIVASLFCVISLLIAPERGLLLRLARVAHFRYRCIYENLLKAIWRLGSDRDVSFEEIAKYHQISTWYLTIILRRLIHYGWLERSSIGYRLTSDGAALAARIVRLHRLWEVYLASYLGVGAERVHRSAEEMEHIITPDLEKQLISLLNDPKYDPHRQPIPPREI